MVSFAATVAASRPLPLRAPAVPLSSRRSSATVGAGRVLSGVSASLFSPPPRPLHLGGGAAIFSCQPRRSSLGFSVRCAALSPEMRSTLDKVVNSHKVLLFMKGTKDFPMCGFSNTVVQILKSLNVPFETFNILDNEMVRQGLKEYSSWPTFPQLYIDGEFFGGCDITVEAYKNGELQELLEKAMCS